MTNFATNWTARYVLTYRSAGESHTMLFRQNALAGVLSPTPQFLSQIHAIFVAMAPMLAIDLAYEEANWYPRGSDTSVPSVVPSGAALVPNGTNMPGSVAHSWSFVGRGGLGANVKYTFFGIQEALFNNQNGDYRYSVTENENVENVLNAFGLASELCAIDREAIRFKQYANVRLNAHWIDERRG